MGSVLSYLCLVLYYICKYILLCKTVCCLEREYKFMNSNEKETSNENNFVFPSVWQFGWFVLFVGFRYDIQGRYWYERHVTMFKNVQKWSNYFLSEINIFLCNI